MHNPSFIQPQSTESLKSGMFITFAGNCRVALTFYHKCFGGILQFEVFDKALDGFVQTPVIIGSLISERISIYGSDLVHDEDKKIGNHLSIFLPCKNVDDRKTIMKKLAVDKWPMLSNNHEEQRLIELTDSYNINWVLGVFNKAPVKA